MADSIQARTNFAQTFRLSTSSTGSTDPSPTHRDSSLKTISLQIAASFDGIRFSTIKSVKSTKLKSSSILFFGELRRFRETVWVVSTLDSRVLNCKKKVVYEIFKKNCQGVPYCGFYCIFLKICRVCCFIYLPPLTLPVCIYGR